MDPYEIELLNMSQEEMELIANGEDKAMEYLEIAKI